MYSILKDRNEGHNDRTGEILGYTPQGIITNEIKIKHTNLKVSVCE